MELNPYNSIKNKFLDVLSRGKWKSDVEDNASGLWSCYVGRRLLHYSMLKNNDMTALNAVKVHPDQRAALLAAIRESASKVQPGAVQVEGDFNALSNSDWLTLELMLIRAQICNPSNRGVNGYDLINKASAIAETPAILRKYRPWYTRKYFILALMGSLYFTGSTLSGYSLSDGGLIMFGIFSMWLGSRMSVYGVRRHFEDIALKNLSTTWDDVFNMKTEEDAILLGMLTGTIHAALDERPDLQVPDFSRMSPATAYQIVSRTLGPEGEVDAEQAVELFEAALKLTAISRHSKSADIVQGVDLSVLRAPTSRVNAERRSRASAAEEERILQNRRS